MAGDWIKLEHTLPDKPEIDRIADSLGIEPDMVVGKLARLWIWADQHLTDGNAVDVTETGLDRRAGQTGLAAAMRKVGWLEGRDGALSFPRFDRHNGQTAKSRASTNRRVATHRAGSGNANVTPPPLQKPLPEKSREETNTPKPPRAPRQARAADTPIQPHVALMESFAEEYEERFKEPHPFQKSNLRAASEAVSRGVTPEMVVEKANMAWDHKEEWMRSACMTFQGLWKQWPKLIQSNGHRPARSGNY